MVTPSVEVTGIKETKEMIKALLVISAILGEQFKDGLQATDAIEVIKKCMTPELEKTIIEAYNGMNEITAELKDLSLMEGLDLIKEISPNILDIIKKVTGK
jgi:hypothetical protein